VDLEKNFEKRNVTNLFKAKQLVNRNFQWVSSKIAQLFANYDVRNPESFTFIADKVLDKKLTKVLTILSTNVEKSITESAVISWGLANQKNDLLANQYLRNIHAATGIKKNFFALNIQAMNEFIKRTENGMNLSERVWNITNQCKSQLETYVGTGITAGRSSQKISQDIRQLLVEPEKLFRRVHNEQGKLVLSKAAKAYFPGKEYGPGVYRSSYKNAMRLAATETNMAYRMSDYARRQQLDFIMGIRVHLSKSHPSPDICDSMKGDYPKDFKYRGWHPWCLCFTTSILMSGSEYRRMQESGRNPKRMVKSIPDGAKAFMKKNGAGFERLKSKPYFISDNAKVFTEENQDGQK